ncbi:ComF family protein [Pseudomonas saudiphocaensis]|uniref:Phosphoribosyl transferase n=1 Tax=Pseudomonas saudiphocaensis TaxID=1499686 RepID=A0A078LWK2_9PSED|nr:ComF family protein [Pseudomonas saudiphocaensis]CDZ94672.1 phosphoribosyl transferase [Pseudomonas saudiphocaensis]
MVYNWLNIEQFCLLCDERCDPEHSLCGACEADLPWLGPQCTVCALPLHAGGLICGQCLKRPPAFDQVVAPWRFDFPIDSLINRFKHQSRWPFGRLLAELLARHMQHLFDDAGLPRPSALLPVPLARKRLRQRGFNQARMLADWLSPELRIPVRNELLQRTLDTPAQQQLDAAGRRRNLRQAFALPDKKPLHDQHLAIIDDVLTTGATAEALARLLKRAGAARVDIYCLARTPKPGD